MVVKMNRKKTYVNTGKTDTIRTVSDTNIHNVTGLKVVRNPLKGDSVIGKDYVIIEVHTEIDGKNYIHEVTCFSRHKYRESPFQ